MKIVENNIGYKSIEPLPSGEELQNFYSNLYYQSPQSSSYQAEYPKIELDFKSFKFDIILSALKQINSEFEGENLLDVGAGEGFMMSCAVNQGLNVIGLDFSSYGVEKFNPSLSHQLIAGDVFTSLKKLDHEKRKFEFCSATNILEHVRDPENFLELISNLLVEQGLFAVTVPNDFSFIQSLALDNGLIDQEFWVTPPQHLHYFNTDTLPRFLRENGFEVLDAFSDFPIDIYLLHPGSNYVSAQGNGSSAHFARMLFETNLIKNLGEKGYLDLYRAMFRGGLGRDITIIARPLRK